MRRSATLFLLIGLLLVKNAWCQSPELLVQGESGKLYLLHTVAAKENWYSVGRLYNLSPKEIAPFNSLTIDKPLSIGQSLEIPLKAVNFSQGMQKAAAGETLVPVYHVVQEKEWMYRISVNHNKVPVDNLEKWNNINKDLVKAGMHLVVGFLKVKTASSALAKSGSNDVVVTPVNKPIVTPVENQAKNKQVSVFPDSQAVNKQSGMKAVGNKPASGTGGAAGNGAATSTTGTSGGGTGTGGAVTGAVGNTGSIGTVPVAGAAHFNGGYFKTDYNDQNMSASGLAGVFKSTSGWQDGKYYALMNNMAVGTIIKVTVSPAGKTIYAKVLGQLPDMKESSGMTIRISNAAASELGQAEGKFNVEVRY